MIALYAGTGAGDFQRLGRAGVNQYRLNAAQVLKRRGHDRASELLLAFPFEMFDAINHFNDEFSVLVASVPLDMYEKARLCKESKEDRKEFAIIAEVFSELGIYIRFIAVELIMSTTEPPDTASQENPFENPEPLLTTMARLFAYEGATAIVAVLSYSRASIQQTDYDNWNGGTNIYTLFLHTTPALFAQLGQQKTEVEEAVLEKAKVVLQQCPGQNVLNSVVIAPQITTDPKWREKAQAWLAGKGVTNQGRVRTDNIAPRTCDGLLFRSQPEIYLYRALKALGVSFAPLPVFIRGGEQYRRIEPDFVLLKDGVVMVIEVDGDTVHQETPAEAHDRTTMLSHEGAFIERLKATECDTAEKAEISARRLVQVLAKRKAAK